MEVHGALDVVGEQGMDHERKAELHGRWRFGEGSSGSVKGLNMMLPDLKPLPSAEEGAADAPASGHVGAGGGEAAEAAEAADVVVLVITLVEQQVLVAVDQVVTKKDMVVSVVFLL